MFIACPLVGLACPLLSPSLARMRYIQRFEELKEEVDSNALEQIEKSIKRGRVTAIEFMFMEGLVAAGLKKFSDAKALVDSAVTQMDAAKPPLVQEDIDSNIWNFGAMVLLGKELK